jgi:serine protease Do
VGELPMKGNLASIEKGEGKPSANALGIVVDDLTAEQRKQLGLKDQGVVITEVKGVARRSTLQPGDVVLMVGRKSIKSAGEFNDVLKDAKAGESVMLLVRRDDITQFVAISVPKGTGKG